MSCDFINPSLRFVGGVLQQDGVHARTHAADMVNVASTFQTVESALCGSAGGFLLTARQVKAPASAAMQLNEKARRGALHKQLITESANY